jgi:cytochrome c1
VLAVCSLAFLSACAQHAASTPEIEGADAERGRIALERHDCGVCHVIPGVRGARGRTGPPLEAYARRIYLAGKFPQEPTLLVRWIRDAPSLAPDTAMPAFELSDAEARDMAAYLYGLK